MEPPIIGLYGCNPYPVMETVLAKEMVGLDSVRLPLDDPPMTPSDVVMSAYERSKLSDVRVAAALVASEKIRDPHEMAERLLVEPVIRMRKSVEELDVQLIMLPLKRNVDDVMEMPTLLKT